MDRSLFCGRAIVCPTCESVADYISICAVELHAEILSVSS